MFKQLQSYFPSFKDGFFTTSDNVKIHYIEAGTGEPLILTSGWPTTPCIFAYNLEALAKHYRVIAIETRGTGESEKVTYGYRVSRTAKDVYDMLIALGITKANFIGHSMGCSTLWAFIDLFGQSMINKLILVDQSPWLWSNVAESDESMDLHAGHRGNPYGLYNAFVQSWDVGNAAFTEPEYWPTGWTSIERSTKDGLKVMALEAEYRQQNNYPREALARLLVNHYMTDWRDIIQIISVPTLIITGSYSHAINAQTTEWMHNAIKGSKLIVFGDNEGGNHIMMANSPEKFNREVLNFLTK